MPGVVVSGVTVDGWAALARPSLRPGLHVVRRDDAHLQLGLDPPDRVVLADRPGLHAALTRLDRPPPESVLPDLERLVADGWVVDAAAESRARREAERRRPPVALDAAPEAAEHLRRACAAASLRVEPDAPVRVVLSLGEPSRAVSDALVRDDVPHLWVALRPGEARLGPFVEPGRTPCLRCVDAHLGETDPRRATVLHQLADRPAGSVSELDPSLLAIATAWAVRDVVRRLDGEVPALRAADVTLTDDLTVRRRTWLRHPHCGCAWG